MSALPGSEPRILVIRGGALGDFILTLPAIRLLREAFPAVHLEILGYKHIIELADGRFYADATRSIEYGPVAAFFARRANLDEELSTYFASFQQIVSYLFDPDGIFDANLRRTGAKNILHAFRKIDDSDHATRQLARPLEQMALFLEDAGARVFPSVEDQAWADEWLQGGTCPLVAIHPGSGSAKKNWPLEHWLDLARRLNSDPEGTQLLLIGGEADEVQLSTFEREWSGRPLRLARHLPLPRLAALLQRCQLFLGHDTGISHLAAAVGTPCLLLFGATDPDVWKPAHPHVQVLEAHPFQMSSLRVETVYNAAHALLSKSY